MMKSTGSLVTDPSNQYRFALVGDPVEQSLSPTIQTAALAMAGLEGRYIAIRCDRAGFGRMVQRLRDGDLNGMNVTMPLKRLAFEMSDRATPQAGRAGSANTLRMGDGLVEAHSTDVEAFEQIYTDIGYPGPLLVLGGGGSAGAAVAAWPGSEVSVSVRGRVRSERLADIDKTPWGAPVPGAVLVNATPLGMQGESIPLEVLQTCSYLIDLPYGISETPASRMARVLGIPLSDGIEFLALQAAHSVRWWTGRAVDSVALTRFARNV